MLIMKTQLLLVVLTVSLGLSCTKSGTPGLDGFYLKFKVNGVQKEYKYVVAAQVEENADLPMAAIDLSGALDASGSEMFGFWLSDFTAKKIKFNFPYKMKFDPSSDPEVFMGFDFKEGPDYATSETDPVLTTPNQIIITELTDKYVKGTFSCELVKDSDGNNLPAKIIITDGEFMAQRVGSAGNQSGPGKGDGYFEYNIENKKYRIDERVSAGNEVSATLTENSGWHSMLLSSSTSQIPSYSNTLMFSDNRPLTDTGTYSMTLMTPGTMAMFLTVGTSTSNTITYGITAASEITVKLTRNDGKKGGKIEGTFNITKMEKLNGSMATVARNLDMTGGKFRATIK